MLLGNFIAVAELLDGFTLGNGLYFIANKEAFEIFVTVHIVTFLNCNKVQIFLRVSQDAKIRRLPIF